MGNLARAGRSQARLADFMPAVPPSFRAAVLAAAPGASGVVRLRAALDTPAEVALGWA
ncbi:hypothetical protein [Corynebacterium phocae]|uniref:hypothetical protein n=1 Tax=Corynebacterium phocae TaxID=161895 RepID=UPI0012ED64EA|nr:hypothetical protein [Corynebacterium phocae]